MFFTTKHTKGPQVRNKLFNFLFFSALSASYTDDCVHNNITILAEPEGYLALFARPFGGTGFRELSGRDHASKTCPWLLVAETGRRFNVSWRLPAAASSFSAFGVSTGLHGHHDGVETGFDAGEKTRAARCWK